MVYRCNYIEYSGEFDENNRASFYVTFTDDIGGDYSVEGYETSSGQVVIEETSKTLPCEIEDMVVDHFDPYTNKAFLDINKNIKIGG